MRNPIAVLACFWLSCAVVADPVDVAMPDRVTLGTVALRLNGAGVRQKFMFDVYAAGLYVMNPSADAATLVAAQAPRRVHMQFLRAVDRSKIVDAWRDGIAANSPAEVHEELGGRIDAFVALFGDVDAGGEVMLDYLPGVGTRVTIDNEERGVVEGKDLNDALLRVWLGPEPVSLDLKDALLGR
jgi:hypothetical protein